MLLLYVQHQILLSCSIGRLKQYDTPYDVDRVALLIVLNHFMILLPYNNSDLWA